MMRRRNRRRRKGRKREKKGGGEGKSEERKGRKMDLTLAGRLQSMGSVNWLEKNASDGTFPVVQWTRIYLPVQGTQL